VKLLVRVTSVTVKLWVTVKFLGTKEQLYITVTFITFFQYSASFTLCHCACGYMFCVLPFNLVNCVLIVVLYIAVVTLCVCIIMLFC
jgi:hypothetical protein